MLIAFRFDMVRARTIVYVFGALDTISLPETYSSRYKRDVWAGWKDAPLSALGGCADPRSFLAV